MGDWYTWSEFKAEVLALLPLERTRLIQGDDGTFLGRKIREGVLDLMEHVPVFRIGHETIYNPSDFITEGYASRGVIRPQEEIRDITLYDTNANVRYPLSDAGWENRHHMTTGQAQLPDNNGLICIDPGAYTFYVYPLVKDGWLVSMYGDGQKLEFQDDEETPFTEQAAHAVAEFVEGKLSRKLKNDLDTYSSYFDPRNGSYTLKRRNLFLTAKARKRTTQ